MLGDLFQEVESVQTNGNGKESSGSTSFGQSPEKRRSVTRLSGLRNQGATCYLNSLIQTLFMTRELRDSLFRLDSLELGEVEGAKEVRKIPVELRRLFSRLLLLDVNAVSTGALTESFGWTGGEVVQQHDVQELNRILFTALEDSLIGTSGSALIRTLYHGELVNQVHCQECGNCSQRKESFLDIGVPVVNCHGLEAALQSLYGEKEFLCGPNQYFCDACNKKVDAFKGAVLSELPQILTVSLLRFQYDWEKGERYKEIGRFAFPDELDMTPYCLGGTAGGSNLYELMSVVVHRGGAHGGHYYAYIRDTDGLGAWSSPSGGGILVETDDGLDLTECDSPLTVLITILTQHRKTSSSPVTVDQLCKLLQKQTGVSWNKRFKRRHGALTKFMRDRADVFCVAAGGEISLADGAAEATTTTSTGAASTAITSSGSADTVSGVTAVDEENKKATNTTAPCSEPDLRATNWFNFNDNWVSPAEKSVLQNTFMGKESAYMVFYRRKEDSGGAAAGYNRQDACNAVPVNLQCEVAAENFDLDEQRDAYEVATNTVGVNVHRSGDFENRYGVVQRSANTQQRVSVDKRKGFSALVSAVDKLESNVTAIYVAMPCPSGLHLLQEIPHTATSLSSCGLLHDSHVLVLNGKEEFTAGDLLIGEDQKPLLIRCKVPSTGDAGDVQNIAERPFSQSTSVSDVVSLFCQQHSVAQPQAVTAFNPREIKPLPLPRDVGALSIKQAGLVDGSLLCFSDGTENGDGAIAAAVPQQTVAQPSVVVENWCHYKVTDGSESGSSGQESSVAVGDWTTKCVYITPTTTVGDVKRSVIEAAAATATLLGSVRLRVEHVTVLGPPLCDGIVVAEHDWPDGQQVVLERGCPPGVDEMLLTFELGGEKRDGRQYEAVVHHSQTVGDCVDAMLIRCCMSGTEWHIRRSNWSGEPAEILDEPLATIESVGVRNGDFLFLLPGMPPPPDCVRLSVFVAAGNAGSCDTSAGVVGWLSSVVSSSLSLGRQALGSVDDSQESAPASSSVDASPESEAAAVAEGKPAQEERHVAAHQFLTTLDVKRTAKHDDLKAALLALPGISNGTTLDPGRLRVRRLQDGHARRIVRQGDSVRSLKLLSGSDIVCEVLETAEILPTSCVVLLARRRQQATRSYGDSEEIVLNTQDGCDATHLRRCLLEHFRLDCSPSDIHCAKQLPDQYDWLPILDQAANTKAQAQKKKGGGVPRKAVNLRNGPVFLQDGDTIAFKLATEERTATLKDFRTLEDEAGLRRLEELKEEKREARKQRRHNNSGIDGAPQRRAEVGIQIIVPKYE